MRIVLVCLFLCLSSETALSQSTTIYDLGKDRELIDFGDGTACINFKLNGAKDASKDKIIYHFTAIGSFTKTKNIWSFDAESVFSNGPSPQGKRRLPNWLSTKRSHLRSIEFEMYDTNGEILKGRESGLFKDVFKTGTVVDRKIKEDSFFAGTKPKSPNRFQGKMPSKEDFLKMLDRDFGVYEYFSVRPDGTIWFGYFTDKAVKGQVVESSIKSRKLVLQIDVDRMYKKEKGEWIRTRSFDDASCELHVFLDEHGNPGNYVLSRCYGMKDLPSHAFGSMVIGQTYSLGTRDKFDLTPDECPPSFKKSKSTSK